jgi:hypothetical protein
MRAGERRLNRACHTKLGKTWWVTLLAALAVFLHPAVFAVTITETASAILAQGSKYEVSFNKINGAMMAISRTTGAPISGGSRNACLWGSIDTSGQYLGGCSFVAGGDRAFTYSIDQAAGIAAFHYTTISKPSVAVDVSLEFAEDAISLQLFVRNDASRVLGRMIFPSDLVFQRADIAGGYLPSVLPGAKIASQFFQGSATYVASYPSYSMFADFAALDVAGTHFAMIGVNPEPADVATGALGFVADSQSPAQVLLTRSFDVGVGPGQSWTSPTYRLLIGSDVFAAAARYRADNGIDAYPSIDAKLSSFGLDRLRAMPFVKFDLESVGYAPFATWPDLIASLPGPLQLHPVNYSATGFDRNDPDFLPPNPALGTVQDFASSVSKLQVAGNVVIPYVNPTYWLPQSLTVSNLPAGLSIRDLAVINLDGTPHYETYDPQNPSGFAVSPNAPFVKTRIGQLMADFESGLGVKCLFEDQVGARSNLLDSNSAATGPASYTNGWLAHVRQYADHCLMTEMGWDRLAKFEAGFHGANYIGYGKDQLDNPVGGYGPGLWQPFPLASIMFGDKVLFYQHDLIPLDPSKASTTFAMRFGMMMGAYVWNVGSSSPYLATDGIRALLAWMTPLQQRVVSRIAGRRATAYNEIAPGITQSDFDGGFTVLANSSGGSYAAGGDRIATDGFVAYNSSGSTHAGIFSGQFNGAPLSAGDHVIVVDSTGGNVQVWHAGPDTALSIPVPSDWSQIGPLEVTALDMSGAQLGTMPFQTSSARVTFTATARLGGQTVAKFVIEPPTGTRREADAIFHWAEQTYPGWFMPAGVASQSASGYWLRYYAASGSYLGVNTSGTPHLFYLGPLSNGAIFDLGLLSSWLGSAGILP